MNKIKTVIFDFDGLVADTEIIAYQTYHDLLIPFNKTITKEEYAIGYCGVSLVNNVKNFLTSYDIPWSFEEAIEIVVAKEKELIARGTSLKPGAKEIFKYLKENGYQAIIGTGSMKQRCVDIIKKHGLMEYVDEVVSIEDGGRSKPHPDIFLKAVAASKTKPEECLVLEDSESGILSAVNANLKVICVPDMKIPKKEILDKTLASFNSLYEVIDYLKENNLGDQL